MKILIACEFSGAVRDAFIEKGHDAISCDILPTESPGPHIQGDVLEVINDSWDMMIAHPPCTYLAHSGVQHLYTKAGRWRDMHLGVKFFNRLMRAEINKICIENPVPHKYAINKMDSKYSQIIQPYMFGHMEQKKTCLWLKGIPPLMSTNNVKVAMMDLPDKERQRLA